ncbi:hypothetical protein [Candidatus Clostridium stratigraminis]
MILCNKTHLLEKYLSNQMSFYSSIINLRDHHDLVLSFLDTPNVLNNED